MTLYSIGEVSKIMNISVRTLRYYDKIALIVPEIRDENTGYRYYCNTQIIYLQLLKELKSFGCSLEEIKNIIYNNTNNMNHIDTLKQQLRSKLDDITTNINKLKFQAESVYKTYEALNRGLNILIPPNNDSNSSFDESVNFKIHELPESWTLSIRKNSNLNAEELFLERCIELHNLMEKYNLFPSGGFICIFHDGYQPQFLDKYGDLELCIPIIKPDNFQCPELKAIGGILVASTIHVGHYKDAYNTYTALAKWVEKEGYNIVGAPFEFYMLDPFHLVSSDSYITKLCFPIAK